MLQNISSVFVVYRCKTLTGSLDPTHANGTDKPCIWFRERLHLSVEGKKRDVVKEVERERRKNPKRKVWKDGRIPRSKEHWKDTPTRSLTKD